MTSTHKTLIAAGLIGSLGVMIYAARHISPAGSVAKTAQQQAAGPVDERADLKRQLQRATEQASELKSENAQLRQEIEVLKAESARLEKNNAEDAAAMRDPTRQTLEAWMDRVNRLRQLLNQEPDKAIPEMQLLTDENWLDATRKEAMTDGDYSMALSILRNEGVSNFSEILRGALSQYESDNGGAAPASVAQLQPYVKATDAPLLHLYNMGLASSGTGLAFTRTPFQDGTKVSFSIDPASTTVSFSARPP